MSSLKGHFISSLKIIQILSVDVVLGAVATGYFASRLLHIAPNPVWWIILTMAVWSFYTLDHLIDGIKQKEKAVINRHTFHYHHRKILGVLAGIFGLTAFFLSLAFLDQHIIQLGLLLGGLVMVYFLALFYWGNKKIILLQKEFIIALVYVFGIWLAPLVWSGQFMQTFIIIVLSVFLLLAWAEGIMASFFDYENDLKDGHSSFTVLFGKAFSRRFLIVVHILVFLLIKISIFFITTNLQFANLMILALMNLMLLLIILYPNWFQKHERYRIFGESIFLLPVWIAFF